MTTSRYPDQQVSLIRKELVALTQDSQLAVVLNQLLYWAQRVKDFDLFLEEERTCPLEDYPSLQYGWIYKTADELIEETLLTVSRPTMRKYLKMLVEEGWIEEKRNSDRKWDRTSHFRLNLKRIYEELLTLGYRLSGFEEDLFQRDRTNEEEERTENTDHNILTCKLKNLTSKSENFPSKERNLTGENTSDSKKLKNLTCKLNNLTPKLENFPSKKRNLTPKLKNLTAYTYTETTTKNTNKEYTQDACARAENFSENFSDAENLKNSVSEDFDPTESGWDPSIGGEMIGLWERHVVRNLAPVSSESENKRGHLHLTEERKDLLESLFAFYFDNDIRLWEQFCLRVKEAPFLMGEGASGWRVTLDWILCEKNLLKVLEGNFDDANRAERTDTTKGNLQGDLATMQPNPAREAEKAALLVSITDPLWREWCSQLAEGVRLNECRMLHEPLSLLELRQIADARVLECEDNRLIWIGSSDPDVLRKIDDLRLKITWVLEKGYPQARTFRTRLLEEGLPLQQDSGHSPAIHSRSLPTKSIQ